MEFFKLQSSSIAGNITTTFTNDEPSLPVQVNFGYTELTTQNSSAADRHIQVALVDPDGNTFALVQSATGTPANVNARPHLWAQGADRETGATPVGSSVQIALPIEFLIPSGWDFQVSVENGIAGDSYDCNFMFTKYKR